MFDSGTRESIQQTRDLARLYGANATNKQGIRKISDSSA
jgi:hypothetical protein